VLCADRDRQQSTVHHPHDRCRQRGLRDRLHHSVRLRHHELCVLWGLVPRVPRYGARG
jgi:hypothetical protein